MAPEEEDAKTEGVSEENHLLLQSLAETQTPRFVDDVKEAVQEKVQDNDLGNTSLHFVPRQGAHPPRSRSFNRVLESSLSSGLIEIEAGEVSLTDKGRSVLNNQVDCGDDIGPRRAND